VDAGRLDREQVLEMLRQMRAVPSVELKMNVPADKRMALSGLRLDPLQGKLREVVFFDTPELTLFENAS
jgi:hypothetical protein